MLMENIDCLHRPCKGQLFPGQSVPTDGWRWTKAPEDIGSSVEPTIAESVQLCSMGDETFRGPRNVFHFVSRTHYLCKSLGMAPFRVVKGPCVRSEIVAENFGLTNIGVMAVLSTLMLYCLYLIYKDDYSKDISMTATCLLFLSLGMVLGGIISMVFLFLHRKKYIQSMNILHEIDVSLKQLEVQTSFRKVHLVGILLLPPLPFVTFLFEALFSVYENKTMTRAFYEWMSFGMAFLIRTVVGYYFIGYVTLIHSRLKNMNNHLLVTNHRFMSQKKKKVHFSTKLYDARSPIFILRSIIEIHDRICEGAKLINEVFSVAILVHIGINFVLVICCVLIVFSEDENPTSATKYIIWTVIFVIQLFASLVPTTITQQEAKRTPELMGHMDICYMNPDLSTIRNTFLLQAYHRNINFEACGWFPLDVSIIIEQVSSISTFTLFLIQVQSAKSGKQQH